MKPSGKWYVYSLQKSSGIELANAEENMFIEKHFQFLERNFKVLNILLSIFNDTNISANYVFKV